MTDAIIAPEGESFPDVERLNIFFKRKLAKAKTEDEAAIRAEWTATKVRWYDEHPQPKPTPVLSEAEAIEAARKGYGDPAGAVGGPMVRVSAPPTPIDVRLPTVQITDQESK